MGFFLHIPVPAYRSAFNDMLDVSEHSDLQSQLEKLFRTLTAYDLVGVHTWEDKSNLEDIFAALRVSDKKIPRIEVHPIGIDPVEFNAQARKHRQEALEWLKEEHSTLDLTGRQLVLGVDRLDYTKGIPERLRGFELMLRQHPELAEKVVLLQIAPISRPHVPMYSALRAEVNATVNTMSLEWSGRPIVHVHFGNVPRSKVAALLRLADVGLLTPLRDGMNLVAKEFVAAHDDMFHSGVFEDDFQDGPAGVLLLSKYTGAAVELSSKWDGSFGAIAVDPYDSTEVATALYAALKMPEDEREKRMRQMAQSMTKVTASKWASKFILSLTYSR
eukprot:TRINITY_DN41741_c0_g1_i1.p1 TRINITY_DN41741_c0_g1~~TRINITY_DN41741_c0_g1_i1.p1  ORF type:complete len:331 (+),score=54.54 TRINITY_DN41741_c0_g1_i1:640-1632(+)